MDTGVAYLLELDARLDQDSKDHNTERTAELVAEALEPVSEVAS